MSVSPQLVSQLLLSSLGHCAVSVNSQGDVLSQQSRRCCVADYCLIYYNCTSVYSQSVLIKMIHFILSPALNNVNNVLINASNQEEFEDSLLDMKDNKNKIQVIFLYFCRFSHGFCKPLSKKAIHKFMFYIIPQLIR